MLQITTDPPPQPYMYMLAAMGLRPTQVPMQMALQDAKGDAALIQFSASGVSVLEVRLVIALAIYGCIAQRESSSNRWLMYKIATSCPAINAMTPCVSMGTFQTAPNATMLCLMGMAAEATWSPLPAVQHQIVAGATVVTNDVSYAEHQAAYHEYMKAVE